MFDTNSSISQKSGVARLPGGRVAAAGRRYAVYYAPAQDHPLWVKGSAWLGRDAASGDRLPQPAVAGISDSMTAMTSNARRYGFHATIKAPMALASGHDSYDLCRAVSDFTALQRPVDIGRLQLVLSAGILLLVPVRQSAALGAVAAEFVRRLDEYRAPVGEAERRKRIGSGLSARQVELLDRYGYPHVLEEWQMHMTLTDRLGGPDRATMLAAAEAYFAPELETPLVLDRVSVFEEPGPGAAFRRIADFPFMGR